MADLVLWLMNRCVDWDFRPLQEALSVKSAHTNARRHKVHVMHRANIQVRKTPQNPNGVSANANSARVARPCELSLEGASFGSIPERDEYFVPIPIKVFGDPDRWATVAEFAPIRARYQHWFDPSQANIDAANAAGVTPVASWKQWWSTTHTDLYPFHVGMNTHEGVGYYEVLEACSQQIPGAKHVLVGYSQLGVVARYLAYVDQFVAKKNLIAGFITVQSPNFGSPVARPANADHVADAVSRALASMAGLTSPPFTRANQYLITKIIAQGKLDIETICGFMEAAVEDLLAMGSGALQYKAQGDALTSALKWASGLRGGPLREKYAFYDLNPDHLDPDADKHSVLGALARAGLTTPRGAVIAVNTRLEDLILGILPKILHDPARLIGGSLRKALSDASEVYKDVHVDQNISQGQDLLARKAREYQQGVRIHMPPDRFGQPQPYTISPRAHDFVIPAAYQVLEPGKAFLGNAVNGDANHLTGATSTDGRPPTDRDLVEAMLHKMGETIDA